MEGANFSKSVDDIKQKLLALSCPYVQNVDDSWIQELIFAPKKPRLLLLQWLLQKLDNSFSEVFQPSDAPALNSFESDAQCVLSIVSNMGLCSSDDINLVKGMTSGPVQVSFMKTLIDLVSEHHLSDGSNPTRYLENIMVLDRIVNRRTITLAYTNQFNFLPPDYQRIIDLRLSNKSSSASTFPGVEKLKEESERLDGRLKELRGNVEQDGSGALRDQNLPVAQVPKQKYDKHLTKLVLTDLNELLTSFICSYKEVMHLCHHHESQLTEEINRDLLHSLNEKIEILNKVLGSYAPIRGDFETTINHLIKNSNDVNHKCDLKSVLEKFVEYNRILQQSSIYSKYPLNN